MTDKLYTRVSPQFDMKAPSGLLVAAERLYDTHGFTELGYDAVDYEASPIVLEVTPKAERYAEDSDVLAAAEEVGIQVWLTREEYLKWWPGAKESDYAERSFQNEGTEPNVLLANERVREALEAKGFDAFRDHVVVCNTEPVLSIFWNPSTFELSGPVAVVADDPGEPYDVRLAEEAAPTI